jgi:hypothetical protein
MTVVYTVGDFAVTQVGPTLFVVAAERIGTLAYFDNIEAAEHQGHRMARAHGVSLWRVETGHPTASRLIASYRNLAS